MNIRHVTNEQFSKRISERPPQYYTEIEPAIVGTDSRGLQIDMDHPAIWAAKIKYSRRAFRSLKKVVAAEPKHDHERPLAKSALAKCFSKVVVISLDRRPDRLKCFLEQLDKCQWPFASPQVFSAVDGDKVPTPLNWHSGGGAWGCMQSHRQILERAIMESVPSLLVLEDDVIFRPTFTQEVAEFLGRVPADWDQLMLGGQAFHNSRKTPVAPGVVRASNIQRTHCYAVRGKYMRDLYQKWCSNADACATSGSSGFVRRRFRYPETFCPW